MWGGEPLCKSEVEVRRGGVTTEGQRRSGGSRVDCATGGSEEGKGGEGEGWGLCKAHFPTIRRIIVFFRETSARLRLVPARCSTRTRLTIMTSEASLVSIVCAFQSASSSVEKTIGFGGMHVAAGCCVPWVPPGELSPPELRHESEAVM